jgi:hypothetical protein
MIKESRDVWLNAVQISDRYGLSVTKVRYLMKKAHVPFYVNKVGGFYYLERDVIEAMQPEAKKIETRRVLNLSADYHITTDDIKREMEAIGCTVPYSQNARVALEDYETLKAIFENDGLKRERRATR